MKTCSTCKQTLELESFHIDKTNKSGYTNKCKECKAIYSKAWRLANPEKVKTKNHAAYLANHEKDKARGKAWRLANPEKVKAQRKARYLAAPEKSKAQSKAWRLANPEKPYVTTKAWRLANPEKAKAHQHAAYLANPEKAKAQSKTRRLANPEKFREYTTAWRLANPEQRRLQTARYDARKRGAPVVEKVTKAMVIEAYGQSCYLCDQPLAHEAVTMDHVVPLTRAGHHTLANLRPCCLSCNARKGPRLPNQLPAGMRERVLTQACEEMLREAYRLEMLGLSGRPRML